MKGIEPSYAAWEAAVLPLNYTRNVDDFNGGTVTTLPINHYDGGDGTVGTVSTVRLIVRSVIDYFSKINFTSMIKPIKFQ